MGNLLTGNIEQCVELLIASGRAPEAAFLARTYSPSLIAKAVEEWKKETPGVYSPAEKEEAFPDIGYGLIAEDAWKRRCGSVEAREYLAWKESAAWDIVEGIEFLFYFILCHVLELKKRFPNGPPKASATNQPSPTKSPSKSSIKSSAHSSPKKTLSVPHTQSASEADEDDIRTNDAMSHVSMEVHTAGTGSARGDLDDIHSFQEE